MARKCSVPRKSISGRRDPFNPCAGGAPAPVWGLRGYRDIPMPPPVPFSPESVPPLYSVTLFRPPGRPWLMVLGGVPEGFSEEVTM